MTTWYLDSSAAMKLLIQETESVALSAALDDEDLTIAGSDLVETELRRGALRRPEAVTQEAVTEVLGMMDVHEIPGSIFRLAGLLATKHLRSLDAIHLAAAVQIGADAVVTYDRQMATAARDLGFKVVAPA